MTERRWFAMGDPQTSLDKVLSVLEAHDLLDAKRRLRPEVGLVSMGDHFDYGHMVDASDREEAGQEGIRVLEWLAGHPRDQARILLGNHDVARVQELFDIDDATFAQARAEAVQIRAMPREERRESEDVWRSRYPRIPTSDIACRDFSAFLVAQRELVQRLLVEGRYDAALTGVADGQPCLLTHTGVTQRELSILEVTDVTPVAIAARLAAFVTERVGRACDAWVRGWHARLDLDPLHLIGASGEECGGWLAMRPANPERPDVRAPEWETKEDRPRRFDPRTLPRGLVQVVGHTKHHKLVKELGSWAELAESSAEHHVRELVVDEAGVRYGHPGRPRAVDAAVMLFTDVALEDAPVDAVELLELDALDLGADR